MKTLIKGGTIVNEGKQFVADLVIDGDHIDQIITDNENPRDVYDHTIDATGAFVLPGVIDVHVHFREPGLTDKADIQSESGAAAAGGVTTYFEMPNTTPQTTSIEAWEDKMNRASQRSRVNYGFYLGATVNNMHLFDKMDVHRLPGVKLFMGASTGNMLVDRMECLEKIFQQVPTTLMVHCEDTALINQNMTEAKTRYGEDPPIELHSVIRNEEACYRSTSLAVKLANMYGTSLHVAHLSTARELELFGANTHITAEAALPHILFTDADYHTLGTQIKCNPSVKTFADREAIRKELQPNGKIFLVATDHAPHRVCDKEGGASKAASGIPMVQFSLVSMLQLVDEGVLSIEQVVNLMCHRPAQRFHVNHRGFIREGMKADLAIVSHQKPWTLTSQDVLSKCGWSPLEGRTFHWKVNKTICNGQLVYTDGNIVEAFVGQAVSFQ